MRSLSEENFLIWVKGNGLLLHPSYPKSSVLSFPAESSESRFWCVPALPEERPYFLFSLLDLMGDWNSCFVWRHMGSWLSPNRINPRRANDVIENRIHQGLGLPLGTADIVEFTREDLPALLILLFTTTVFGWSVGEDLYVVPDHTRFFLKTDHHEVVHVEFRQSQDVSDWVSLMSGRGFNLPEDIPDNTFKRPNWIK
jgi:hypothetical protein